jgi:serine/threonine-protein kinase
MTARPSSLHHTEARADSPRFLTGRLLAGRYELVDLIGDGATAEVFRARDHRLDRMVAVKVLRPQYGRDTDARERFAVEARSAAALAVPNIVPVYDFGATDDGLLFIVMRLIDGPSLRQLLAERGALPAVEVVDIGRQIATALAAAHGRGLVHRDVKPGNILIDAAGTAHLTDFGTVKILTGAARLTRTGMTFGTAAYIAPEQATGGRVGPQADVYALGAVLYEALAGRPPFAGEDPIAVSYSHVHEPAVPLAALVHGVPADVEALVMRCLAKSPADRPQSAAEVHTELEAISRRLAPPPPPVLATLAAPSASVRPAAPPPQPPDVDAETVYMPARRAAPPTAVLGVTRPHRIPRVAGTRGRPPVTALTAILLFTLLALLVAAILALLAGDPSGHGAAIAPTRATAASASGTLVPATATSGLVTSPGGLSPSPSAAPTTATPEPTAIPTPAPTAIPTPQPTAKPTPLPTAAPTAAPAPTTSTLTARIPNRLFVGDYDGPTAGRYHGRSASWVYGQGTSYATMTAHFSLDFRGDTTGRATLRIVGLDGDDPAKQPISIAINGVTIYEGADPLPNDFCCGPSGPGNWGSATFRFAADILRRNNTLTITNLGPSDCTVCPKYVMVDYADLDFRVRS